MSTKVIPLSGVTSAGEWHPPRFERVPPPPRRLNGREKEVWREAAKELHDRAILTVLDTMVLEMYCTEVARVEECEAEGLAATTQQHKALMARMTRMYRKGAREKQRGCCC